LTDPGLPCRDDIETTTHPGQRPCPVCGTSFVPTRRQRYDTNACRQIAYRRRTARPTVPDVPAERRRDTTVYRCTECDTRYLGQQWCFDCVRPCRRLGSGGECIHCGDPLTVDELLGGAPMA